MYYGNNNTGAGPGVRPPRYGPVAGPGYTPKIGPKDSKVETRIFPFFPFFFPFFFFPFFPFFRFWGQGKK